MNFLNSSHILALLSFPSDGRRRKSTVSVWPFEVENSCGGEEISFFFSQVVNAYPSFIFASS